IMHRKPIYLIFMWLALAAPIQGLAQVGSSTLSGFVTDTSGAIIAGATVTAKNIATGAVRSITIGKDGNYTITALPPGLYEVTFEAFGFKKRILSSVMLEVSMHATINVVLERGEATETITVTSEAPLIETNATIGNTVNDRMLRDLPLNGR